MDASWPYSKLSSEMAGQLRAERIKQLSEEANQVMFLVKAKYDIYNLSSLQEVVGSRR